MCVTKQLIDPIDFHSIFVYMEVSGVHQLFGYTHSSKLFYFVFNRRKKQIWNNLILAMIILATIVGQKCF